MLQTHWVHFPGYSGIESGLQLAGFRFIALLLLSFSEHILYWWHHGTLLAVSDKECSSRTLSGKRGWSQARSQELREGWR